jgi:hypothetical protein
MPGIYHIVIYMEYINLISGAKLPGYCNLPKN